MADYEFYYTDMSANPLTLCPGCGASLTRKEGIAVELTNGTVNWTIPSRLNRHGLLQDPTNEINDGFHCATFCATCNAMLINYDSVIETLL